MTYSRIKLKRSANSKAIVKKFFILTPVTAQNLTAMRHFYYICNVHTRIIRVHEMRNKDCSNEAFNVRAIYSDETRFKLKTL